MMETNSRKEVLRAFIQAVWNEGDADSVDRFLSPLYRIRHDPGDPWNGQELDHAKFKERLRISRAPFPDQRFDIQELFAEGETVVMTWLWSGTHRGDLPGFPASGRRIRMSGITVYDFEGGRICGHWQEKDALGVYGQLRQN